MKIAGAIIIITFQKCRFELMSEPFKLAFVANN